MNPTHIALVALILSCGTFVILIINTVVSNFKPRSASAVDERLASMAPNVLTPDQRGTLEHRITDLESTLNLLDVRSTLQKLATLEAQITPFLRVIEVEMGRKYHSPHTPDFDLLIEKNEQEGLDPDEARVFLSGIKELAAQAASPGEEALLLMWTAAIAAKYQIPAEEVAV